MYLCILNIHVYVLINLMILTLISSISRSTTFIKLDVHGSLHHNINLIEITNQMGPCIRIYYSDVSSLLNMFRATHRSSSGAQKL